VVSDDEGRKAAVAKVECVLAAMPSLWDNRHIVPDRGIACAIGAAAKVDKLNLLELAVLVEHELAPRS
jgi:hypothetical protein